MYTPKHLRKWSLPESYFGATWEGYYVAPVSRHRDSDVLTESNWAEQWSALKKHHEDVDADDTCSPCVVTEKHWAVGWVEWVAIHESNQAALMEADRIAEMLESHPVLNESDYSEREATEAYRVWKDCYSVSDRIRYIRNASRGEFEFRSFSDLLGCVRGKYFAGCASELLA